jgi:hypothetical protein
METKNAELKDNFESKFETHESKFAKQEKINKKIANRLLQETLEKNQKLFQTNLYSTNLSIEAASSVPYFTFNE